MGDQFDHAKRLEKLEAGISAPVDAFIRDGADLLRKLLSDPDYEMKAGRVAQKVRAESGADVAADMILEIIRK